MILGQRIRLDPNDVQATFFARCAGAARFTYNWGFSRWQEQYKAGEKPSWQALNKELNAVKAEAYPWMSELSWAIPTKALSDLGVAFANFFRRVKAGQKPGYPRFKKKGRCREGFAIDGREFRFDGKRVKVPKLGWVRARQELRFPGKVLSARFSARAGHWYVSIHVEVDDSWSYPNRCKTQAAVGIDLGVRDLAVLSTGEKIEAPRSLRRHEAHLRRLNKELHRRKKGGSNRRKTQAKLARLRDRVSSIRQDVTHKLTARLVRDYAIIGVESLNVAGMKRGRRLAKSISDAALGEVLRQLDYKAELAGSVVVKADRWFPSSKTCADCGHVVERLPLDVREWGCPACGVVHDRDVNAAINLKKLALAQRVTACRQGSTGRPMPSVELPLGQESSRYVSQG